MIQLGDYKVTSRGEYRYCCPFCITRVGKEDKKYHLYVNPTTDEFYCYRCSAKGNTARLFGSSIKVYGASKWEEFVKSARYGNINQTAPHIFLPKDYCEMLTNTRAYRYLQSRGITDKQINLYNIGFSTKNLRQVADDERKLYVGSGRVIFPDFDATGNCVYWIARTYVNHGLRYKNPPASIAASVLYNHRLALQYEDVVITEGPISAIAAGENAIGTLGKSVTREQIELLVAGEWNRYIIALDGDAKKEALGLANKLSSRGCSVSIVNFNYGEDPASVSNVQERISNATPYSTVKNRVTCILQGKSNV